MTTTSTRAGTPKSPYTQQLIDLVTQSVIPDGLPAGAKITLLADRERALRAAEEARLLATGDVSWDQDYPEVACELFPQDAATERAVRLAKGELTSLYNAIAAAIEAVTR